MSQSQIELKAYGKINLGLDVVRKREDGYHEVCMIMQTVGIYDKITMRRNGTSDITVETNLPYIPNNENNLAYKAARLIMDEYGLTEAVDIVIKKVIPVAAGMAGGSANAAAVLVGMNRLYGLGLSKARLMELGVRLGADVPYCILRGTALSEGIGERLTPLPPPPPCHLVLAKPQVSVSTKAVYGKLRVAELPAAAHPDIFGMKAAIEAGDLSGIISRLGNVLETVTIPDHPEIGAIKEFLLEKGADGVLMSGSGPTVFGLFRDAGKAAAAGEALKNAENGRLARQVYVTGFYNPRTPGMRFGKEERL